MTRVNPKLRAGEPAVSLPKGGGAIRGMGEKFAQNPVTGTGSVSVTIPTSPGRSGFGPQLSLTYDSGIGKTAYGFGWTVSLPAITRKTDKGLPTYDDEHDSDVFLLSGAEDLVPVVRADGKPDVRVRAVGPDEFRVRRYRPRIESEFARIECWTHTVSADTHWRSISRDNVTTLYGTTDESRISAESHTGDGDAKRVFSWLICECFDDRGNAVAYSYKAEDAVSVDLTQTHERNRSAAARTANRYLKSVRYGNVASRLSGPDFGETAWLFELVFDYGEHDLSQPGPRDTGSWLCRRDPFSSYRSGFEVRTYRLCQRVLMFHHFPDELEVGADCLVRSLDLRYRPALDRPDDTRRGDPLASFLASITQTGYRRAGDRYVSRSMPPLEFGYTVATIDQTVRTVHDYDNLPIGIDGEGYQLVDLDGEGVVGILSRQAGAWYYKPGLGDARFDTLRPVTSIVSTALERPPQLLDLAGDGLLDVVDFGGPTPGFAERTPDGGWANPVPFRRLPTIAWNDGNLRFADLTGDGLADVLITEDDSLVYYPSLGEDGFGPARRVQHAGDERAGPRLVFADGTQSVFLASMSGDGLSDLVRIRNSEVCYWPNLGYGRFGAKVTMDASPRFDHDDVFDPQRLRLADIDGTGSADLIYLGADGTSIWFNQSGNRWSAAELLGQVPAVENVSAVSTVDLLGNGTACLVWSSPLPANMQQPLLYLDLMGGNKPHLLVSLTNNLGAETRISYVPSTRYYLEDKAAGRPWLSRLSFPVHVVERVVTNDRITRNRFITRYAYHHGHFDGDEREFRGFGLVEQFDSDEFGAFGAEATMPAAANAEPGSHVPVVVTRTWFHTGARPSRKEASQQYAADYYPEPGRSATERQALRLHDSVLPALTPDEQGEAYRALKGMVLRREVYALDGTDREPRPYAVTESNYRVEVVQHRGVQRHGVFFTHPLESITYRYERAVYAGSGGQLVADPRVSHDLILEVDPFGTVLKSVTVGYGRRQPGASLAPADRTTQAFTRVRYTETSVTNSVIEADELTVGDDYRTPVPWEARSYELTGYAGSGSTGRFRPGDFVHEDNAVVVHTFDSEIPFEQEPSTGRQRRLVQQVRTLMRSDDLTTLLAGGVLAQRAMPGESYQLAFTPGLITTVFQRSSDGEPLIELLPNPAAVLSGQGSDRGGYVDLDGDGRWWVPAGRQFYSANTADTPDQELEYAQAHFFRVLRQRDVFGQTTTLTYDDYDLLILESRDPLGNRLTVGERRRDGDIDKTKPSNDYRTLQPALLSDANRNRTAVAFDALGLVVGIAVMGKPEEALGDSLAGFNPDLSPTDVRADPRAALHRATTRLSYTVAAYEVTRNDADPQPTSALTLAREVHDSDPGGAQTRIQQSYSYSDGFGREIQKKIQAEPGGTPGRWVTSGWMIFNNKGQVVREYQPFFTGSHEFEYGNQVGVSQVHFYDPLDRLVATLHPDHTYEKVVFDAWRKDAYDRNDTAAARGEETGDPRSDPDIRGYVSGYFASRPASWQTWWSQRQTAGTDARESLAAQQAAVHADTPTSTVFDGLGQPFLTVARNRFDVDGAIVEETYSSRVELDIEGHHRVVRDPVRQDGDPLGRIVMRYTYDLLGRRLSESSMDAGDRWVLSDAAGQLIRTWDSREHAGRMGYDPLRRPVRVFVTGADLLQPGREVLTERRVYGEQHPDGEAANLRGAIFLHADQAGMRRHDARDFKGNLLRSTRQLGGQYRQALDWWSLDAALPAPGAADPLDRASLAAALTPIVDAEVFSSETTYDALSRTVTMTSPDGSVVRHRYNEASLLDRVDANLRGATTNGQPVWTSFVSGIDYDAHGQRTLIEYGNGARTSYQYDGFTFRLSGLVTERPGAAFPDDCPDPAPVDWPGCQVQNLQYTYDPVGNLTHVRDRAQQAVFFRNRRVDASASYTYDAVYRLIGAAGREHLGQAGGAPIPHGHHDEPRVGVVWAGNDGNAMGTYFESYRYDAAGNLLRMGHRGTDPAHPGWIREFGYAEASLLEAHKSSNRLSSTVLTGDNAVVELYRHDAHGNMIRMPHLGGAEPTQNLHWNYHDDLSRVDLGGGGTAYYTYDAAGTRIRKVWEKSPSLVEERIYLDGFELFRRRDGGGQLVLQRETLHVMDSTRRIALVETRTPGTGGNDPAPPQLIRYQVGAFLGSVHMELDEQAKIISYEEYTPYGSSAYQAVRSATETPKRYRCTGKERDEESGLYYHGSRYYAPWLVRWTSCDPSCPEEGVNAYEYVNDNPVVLFDPDGNAPKGGNNPMDVAAFEVREAAFEAGKKLETGKVKATSGGTELGPPRGKTLRKLVGNSDQAKELRLKYSGAQGVEAGKVLRRNIAERSGAAASGQEGGHFGEASQKLVPEVGVHKRKVITVDVEPGGQPPGSRTADVGIAKEPTSPEQWPEIKGKQSADVFEKMVDQKVGGGRVADKPGFRKQSGGVPIEEIRPSSKPGSFAKGLGGKAVGGLNAVAPIWDAYKMARESHIAEQGPGRAGVAVLKDEFGKYTLQIREHLLFNDYQKTYISGERSGTVQELGLFEWLGEVSKRNAKYGYFDWAGDWVSGEVPAIVIERNPILDNMI